MPDTAEDTEILESTDTPEIDPVADSEDTSTTAADVAAASTPIVEEVTPEVEPQEEVAEPDELDEAITDWEKRYNDQQTYVGQQSSEIHRLKNEAERYAQLGDPQQAMQQLQQFRDQSEKQELKQWNSRSPQYANFQSVRAKADAYNKLIQDASPEMRESLSKSAGEQFSADEMSMMKAYNEHNASTQRQLAEDPEGFINNIVSDMVQSRFNEYEQYQGQRTSTDQYMDENKDLIEKHGDDFMRIIGGEGSSRDLAVEYVQMKEELDALKAQVGQNLESTAHAEAQTSAMKRTASVKRDLSTSVPQEDPVALAKEKGLTGMARLRFIEAYNNKG